MTKPRPLPNEAKRVLEGLDGTLSEVQGRLKAAITIITANVGDKDERVAVIEAVLDAATPLSIAQRVIDAILSDDIDRARKHLGL